MTRRRDRTTDETLPVAARFKTTRETATRQRKPTTQETISVAEY